MSKHELLELTLDFESVYAVSVSGVFSSGRDAFFVSLANILTYAHMWIWYVLLHISSWTVQ